MSCMLRKVTALLAAYHWLVASSVVIFLQGGGDIYNVKSGKIGKSLKRNFSLSVEKCIDSFSYLSFPLYFLSFKYKYFIFCFGKQYCDIEVPACLFATSLSSDLMKSKVIKRSRLRSLFWLIRRSGVGDDCPQIMLLWFSVRNHDMDYIQTG